MSSQRQKQQQQQQRRKKTCSSDDFMSRAQELHAFVVETVKNLLHMQRVVRESDLSQTRQDELLGTLEQSRQLCQTTLEDLTQLMTEVQERRETTAADCERVSEMNMSFGRRAHDFEEIIIRTNARIEGQVKQEEAKDALQAYRRQRGGAALLGRQMLQGTVQAARHVPPPPPLEPFRPSPQEQERLQAILRGQGRKPTATRTDS